MENLGWQLARLRKKHINAFVFNKFNKQGGRIMLEKFPDPIRNLPHADIPLEGLKAYLSQSDNHQILFMEFAKNVEVPEHSHSGQIGFILEGRIDLIIDGVNKSYSRGDYYFIPEGVKHSAKIYAGYADITFFDEPNRYSAK